MTAATAAGVGEVAGWQLDPLQEFIHKRRDELGIKSWAELGRRGGLSRMTVKVVATEPRRGMPNLETLEGLAKGLDVPLVKLRELAYKARGLPYDEREIEIDGRRATLKGQIDGLDDDTVVEILDLLDTKRRAREPNSK